MYPLPPQQCAIFFFYKHDSLLAMVRVCIKESTSCLSIRTHQLTIPHLPNRFFPVLQKQNLVLLDFGSPPPTHTHEFSTLQSGYFVGKTNKHTICSLFRGKGAVIYIEIRRRCFPKPSYGLSTETQQIPL